MDKKYPRNLDMSDRLVHVSRLRAQNAVHAGWREFECSSVLKPTFKKWVKATRTRWPEAVCRSRVRARRPCSQGMTDQVSGQCRRFAAETGLRRNTSDLDTSQWRADLFGSRTDSTSGKAASASLAPRDR